MRFIIRYHNAVPEENMGPVKFVGLCFLIFTAFGAGYYYNDMSTTEPFLAYAKPAVSDEECEVPQTLDTSPEDYCAILTMPKTFIPFLERLKRNKLAKDVVITPATIENENGRLTAVAKNTVAGEKIAATRQVKQAQINQKEDGNKDNSFIGALAVYFLAGSKQQESP